MSKLPEVANEYGLIASVIADLISALLTIINRKRSTPESKRAFYICCGALVVFSLLTAYLVIHKSDSGNPCTATQSSGGAQSPNVSNCGNGNVDIRINSDKRSTDPQPKEPVK